MLGKQHVLWDGESNHRWEIIACIDDRSPEMWSVRIGHKVISPSYTEKDQRSDDKWLEGGDGGSLLVQVKEKQQNIKNMFLFFF